MIYRVVNAERMPQVEELWDYCFEKRQEPFFQYYFNEYVGKKNMVIGGFEKFAPERLSASETAPRITLKSVTFVSFSSQRLSIFPP